ncbi:MAG: hypothetical protein EBR02_06405 [Alphaproteobacteria bacterium]|nr:hypothetical protein [Alphaproteobacteria bacterium]
MSEKHIRAHDRSDYIDIQKSGFVVRKNTPIAKISEVFKWVSVVVLVVSVAMYYDSLIGFGICVGGGALALFLGRQLERMQKIQQSTEFVSAIFSSALGKGYLFCIAIREDGEIVYLNRPFQTSFPDFIAQPKLTLQTLMKMQGVSEDDSIKIRAAISRPQDSSVTINMVIGNSNTVKPITFCIEPIERPSGFLLIRGK